MGQGARSGWIIRIFALVLGAISPLHAHATATANGVALNAGAGCDRGDLDLTLATASATSEYWLATNLAGATLAEGERATDLSNFPNASYPSGTFPGFRIGPFGFSPTQPDETLIGSYAYVGDRPPSASNTAEFFVYYNCSTRVVLYSCIGAYGSCPQTAQRAAALLARKPARDPSLTRAVPVLGRWGLPLTVLVVAAAGAHALRRRARKALPGTAQAR